MKLQSHIKMDNNCSAFTHRNYVLINTKLYQYDVECYGDFFLYV